MPKTGGGASGGRPAPDHTQSTSDILRPVYKPQASQGPLNRTGKQGHGGGKAQPANPGPTQRTGKQGLGGGSQPASTGPKFPGHPANADHLSPDGRLSYDENNNLLDSNGNIARGDFAMGRGGGGGGGGGGGSGGGQLPQNPLGLTQPTQNPFNSPPWFAGQSPDWWANTGHVAAANAWNGAMLPWYEWANNAANSQNTWNNNQWQQGWGAMTDQFGMGMDIANLQANYLQGLNNLDYNAWATGLESTGNALASMGDMYGNLNRAYNDMYGNMYGADMGYLGNLVGAQNQWDVAQMQALNDWYNQQARNQTDLQVATMQAFGRQQAPNARFMQNWG